MTLTLSPESHFLTCLFTRLNDARVNYAVMRNHKPLPHSSGGSDLDIIVRPIDTSVVESIVYEAIHAAGGVAIGRSKIYGFFKVYAFGNVEHYPTNWWGQRIDVNIGFVYKGLPLLEDEAWGNFICQHNNIPVLGDGLAGVLGVLKEVLSNSQVPARYLPLAQKASAQDWQKFKELFRPMGESSLEILRDLVVNPPCNGSEAAGRCRDLRKALALHLFSCHPRIFCQRRLSTWLSKIYRYLRPSGKIIAILGTDGAGKSTVINTLMPILSAATHNAVIVRHLRPGLFPPLAKLKGKKAQSISHVQNPHGSKSSGRLGSLLRFGYLLLDYILGYWLKIRPQIAKQPTVVIFDRYAYDMLLDPKRFRINLPVRLRKLLLSTVPRPNIVFCLHGHPRVIFARKNELSIGETSRQIVLLQQFATCRPWAYLISTDKELSKTIDEILFLFKNYLAGLEK